MANWISKQLGGINKELIDLTLKGSDITTSYVNKAWRAAILLHRATHATQGSTYGAVTKGGDPAKGKTSIARQVSRGFKKSLKDTSTFNPESISISFSLKAHDELEDLKKKTSNNQIILYNLTSKPYQYVVIQNRPNKLEFKGETTWASIKSMGRNTPMYHYTGSEDTIQFNISWYCDDPSHPDEVVNKCRFLEAWTKSNGYQASPPVIQIQWGNSDIFKDHTYILTSATYTLENFNDCSRINFNRYQLQDGKLLPSTATQELIFKRVSATNLAWNDILPIDKMNYTRGLNRR